MADIPAAVASAVTTAALEHLTKKPDEARLPLPAEISRLVLEHLEHDPNFLPGERSALRKAWQSGATWSDQSTEERLGMMPSDWLDNVLAQDAANIASTQAIFEEKDKGKHKLHMTVSQCQ